MSYEYRNFTLTDTTDVPKERRLGHYKESVLSIGGELSKRQGKLLHYNILGELAIAGEDAGQFNIEGNGDLNIPLFDDTIRLEANAFIKTRIRSSISGTSILSITGGTMMTCPKSCVPDWKAS